MWQSASSIGSTLKLDLVWSPFRLLQRTDGDSNALALWALAGVVNSVRKQYGEKKKEKIKTIDIIGSLFRKRSRLLL